MKNNDEISIHRSSIAIFASTIDGFVESLQFAAQAGQAVAPSAVALYRVILKRATVIMKGAGVEEWPELDDHVPLGDLLVYAGTLRSVFFSFLTPDQMEEFRKTSVFKLAEFDRERKRDV